VHSFRISTAILAWGLIVAAFYYRPDLLKWVFRTITYGIETIGDSTIGDSLPYKSWSRPPSDQDW
jgi:hypothetical protein